MLVAEREGKILATVNQRGSVTVHDLAALCRVTEVTIRRDLQRLKEQNQLRRTHGGAVSKASSTGGTVPADPLESTESTKTDALILAPVQHRAAHALRERALRSRLPLLAESAAQEQAIFLGPDNFRAAQELGLWTADYINCIDGHLREPVVLDVTHEGLSNTRERSAGFVDGLQSALKQRARIISINGRGLYDAAYQIAADALKLHPEINVIFGVNDDAVLAALQASVEVGRDPDNLLAVNVGGEGNTVLDALQRRGPLKACMALFPEVVGYMAVDATVRLWSGEDLGEVITPSRLLTPDTLADLYRQTGHGWALRAGVLDGFLHPLEPSSARQVRGKHLSFVIQYRTHEWYQNLAQAMRERAEHYGLHFAAIDVDDDFEAEIRDLRRLIGKVAASYVEDGDTIILDAGTTTASMAQFLHGKRDVTVITNALDVFKHLQQHPDLRLKLTGGDFNHTSRALVGHGALLLLHELRADKVFLVAGGVSASFGISSVSAQEAEVRRAMIGAAREVIVLADHTVLDLDANARVTGLDAIDTLITDAGILSSQSLELTRRGINVIVAGRVAPL